jgi:uncharacterized FAD-dependent dehydrogenase
MAVIDRAERLAPFVEELLENAYARENLRAGVANLRAAYERSQKRRVKIARDQRLRREVRAAAESITEAGKALKSGRQQPARHWGRRLVIVIGLGGLGVGAALAANEDLRSSVFGEDTVEPEPTPATPSPSPDAAAV